MGYNMSTATERHERPVSPVPFPHEPVPPDLLAWARQTFDAGQFAEEIREMQATGGYTFESFIDEVEKTARQS